jgi:hypothetical protein
VVVVVVVNVVVVFVDETVVIIGFCGVEFVGLLDVTVVRAAADWLRVVGRFCGGVFFDFF